jgi:hemerythrin-like domain-containing protein
MIGNDESASPRRTFIRQGGLLLGAAALSCGAMFGCAQQPAKVEVSAAEDLMEEHGVLRRLLLIYDEMARRLECCTEFAPEVLTQAATLVHGFVQERHEKLEEEQVFPLFEKAEKHLALVKILRRQHEASRRITTYLLHHATAPQSSPNFIQRAQLGAYLRLYTRMYRVHAAQEDTVLFPALRTVVPPAQYLALGRTFAPQDQDRNGPQIYGRVLAQVVDLEKSLGLDDLEKVTPRI